MARTRTSADLHDNATPARHTHAKPPLYAGSATRVVGPRTGGNSAIPWSPSALARVAVSLSCAVLLMRSVSAAGQDPADRSSAVPCAACTVVSLTPSQAARAPANLAGSRVLLRIAAGEGASAWTAALADLRDNAGRVGFHIVGVPEASDSALDQ